LNKPSRLADHCELITKGTTPTTLGFDFVESGVPFLRVQNIDGGRVNYTTDTLFIDEKTHRALDRSNIRRGDILVSIAGTIGRAAVVPDDAPPLNCNQAVAIVRTRETVFRPFIRYWLESPGAQRQMRGATVTGTISNLSLTQLGNLKLQLPPIREQKRVSEILDQAHALRAKRRAALVKLDSLAQSIFIEMFGDPVTNTKRWPDNKSLGQVSEIVSGITKGRKLHRTKTRPVPYLAVINVQDRRLNLSVVKTIEASDEEINRYRLKLGDLLLTEGGDPDKLGRGTLWNDEMPECIHQNHIFRVRITDECLHPIYLNWLVGSERGKRYFLRSAKQTTGIASINMRQLRAFPLLVPPIDLQYRFAKRLAAVDELRISCRASLEKLDNLFSSLQGRAFESEVFRPPDSSLAAAE
jgi:type I restriction enzyme S subunit